MWVFTLTTRRCTNGGDQGENDSKVMQVDVVIWLCHGRSTCCSLLDA